MVAPKVKRRRLAALKKSADLDAARLVEEAAQAEALLRTAAAKAAKKAALAVEAKVAAQAAALATKEVEEAPKKSVRKKSRLKKGGE